MDGEESEGLAWGEEEDGEGDDVIIIWGEMAMAKREEESRGEARTGRSLNATLTASVQLMLMLIVPPSSQERNAFPMAPRPFLDPLVVSRLHQRTSHPQHLPGPLEPS